MAGSIQKGHKAQEELGWSEAHFHEIEQALEGYGVTFLNPAFRTDDLSDQRSVFGRDMTMVYSADAVLVDVREKRGIGVGAEMMWAKVHRIPVISWAPKESHYNKTATSILGVQINNFIHPFVESLSDYVAVSLADAIQFLKNVVTDPTFTPRGIEYVTASMEYYLTKNGHQDIPMQQILQSNPIVREKIEALTNFITSHGK